MPAHVFWLQHSDLIGWYFAALFVSVIVHHFVFSRYVFGILDPLFYLEVSFIFSMTTAWYVAFINYMQPETYYLLVACQGLAYLGFVLVAPTKARIAAAVKQRLLVHAAPSWSEASMLLLRMGVLCYVGTTLLDYALAGIPILRAFRQGAFQGSGGLGIISRLEDISSLFISLLVAGGLLYIGRSKRTEFVGWLLLALMFAVLSGAKAGALVIAQIIFVIFLLRGGIGTRFITVKSLLIVGAVALGALIILATGTKVTGDLFSELGTNRLVLAFAALLYRLVNFGDIFISSFPQNTLGNIADREGWVALFAGVLTTFRLVDPTTVPLPLGYELMHYIFPGIGTVGGPNAYFSVFAFHYWGGWGAMAFSLVVGLIFGFARRLMLFNGAAIYESKSPEKSLFSTFLFVAGWILQDITTDPPYIVSRLVSVFLLFCFIGPFVLAGWYAGHRKSASRSAEVA